MNGTCELSELLRSAADTVEARFMGFDGIRQLADGRTGRRQAGEERTYDPDDASTSKSGDGP